MMEILFALKKIRGASRRKMTTVVLVDGRKRRLL